MAVPQATDLSKWKLHNDRGRQTWHYTESQTPVEQKFYDRYFLGLDTVRGQLREEQKKDFVFRDRILNIASLCPSYPVSCPHLLTNAWMECVRARMRQNCPNQRT